MDRRLVGTWIGMVLGLGCEGINQSQIVPRGYCADMALEESEAPRGDNFHINLYFFNHQFKVETYT